MVAFGVIPLFVRHTVYEPPLPSTDVRASATPLLQGAAIEAPRARSGSLRKIDAVHYGSGSVTLTETASERNLRFENVDIAGAPNMFVYLSDRNDGQPGHYVDLGALKATNGSFNYAVPADADLSAVHSVVVWCRAFTVTVTWTPLN